MQFVKCYCVSLQCTCLTQYYRASHCWRTTPSLLFVPFLSILYVVKLYKKERSAAVKDGLQTKQIKTCQISDLSLGRLYPQIRPQKLISRIPRSLPLCWSRFTRKMKSKIGKILQNNMEITP